MRKVIWGIAALVACCRLAAASAPPGNYGQGSILELGGSNYTFYDQGDYATTHSYDVTVRPAIGTYQLNPSAVENQIIQLYASGQRKIALLIWFSPFASGPPNSAPGMYDYLVDSSQGQLIPQHKANFQAILRIIKALGFNEVVLRFAQQGTADPSTTNPPWNSGWSESQYQQNLSFILSTRDVMENELSSTPIIRRYDLGTELGGVTSNQAPAYVTRLWSDYVNSFGGQDSYGFSVAYAPGRMAQLVKSLVPSGTKPTTYALDMYESPTLTIGQILGQVSSELKTAGEGAKPLIVQEVYADDATAASGIVKFLATNPLKIQYLMQWPVSTTNAFNNLTPAAQYEQYGGSTSPSGTLTSDPCVLQVQGGVCSTWISWATSNATNVKVLSNGALMANQTQGSNFVKWISSATANLQISSDQGVLAALPVTALAVGAPSLDPFGAAVGCGSFQCVVATGSGIAAGCIVDLFSPDGTKQLGLAQVTSCLDTGVTFDIPASVQSAYTSVYFNLTNANGATSVPLLIPITRPTPVIFKAGLGCNAKQCIWVNGANFDSSCSVNIFKPDWSEPALLATVTSLSCGQNGVSFVIPPAILQGYPAINFNVSSSYGVWSTPYYIAIH